MLGLMEALSPCCPRLHIPSLALPEASICLLGDSGPIGMNARLGFHYQASGLSWDFRARPELVTQLHYSLLTFGQSPKPREGLSSDLGQTGTAEHPASAQP